ncbi:MAG: DnaB-like helicase C-terminal domain-containing protein, partial [Candidatus Eremiobacterota bacterium]
YTRIICRLARLGETELRLTGIPADKFEDYKKAIEKFKILGNNLFVVTNRKIELTDIFQQIDYAREITDKKKILLVFDSLQKLPVKSLRDRRSGIDSWLRDLEEIRDRKEVEILLISEIKRDDRGGGYRPLVDSFKESGDIEYTADTALGIYRPDAEDNTLVRLEVLAGRDVESGIVSDYRVKYPFWEFEEINQRERNKRSGREEDL